MDCFAEPVIGPRVRADPLARNDGLRSTPIRPAGCIPRRWGQVLFRNAGPHTLTGLRKSAKRRSSAPRASENGFCNALPDLMRFATRCLCAYPVERHLHVGQRSRIEASINHADLLKSLRRCHPVTFSVAPAASCKLPCSAGAVDNVQQSAVFLFRNSKFSLHKARRLRLAAEDREGATLSFRMNFQPGRPLAILPAAFFTAAARRKPRRKPPPGLLAQYRPRRSSLLARHPNLIGRADIIDTDAGSASVHELGGAGSNSALRGHDGNFYGRQQSWRAVSGRYRHPFWHVGAQDKSVADGQRGCQIQQWHRGHSMLANHAA